MGEEGGIKEFENEAICPKGSFRDNLKMKAEVEMGISKLSLKKLCLIFNRPV